MPVITAGRFAAATSVLALAVAMGGTGYAAAKIKTNQIAKNAITSKLVKNDNLTGKDIKESSLAKVPSAGTADSAASAANAASVGGNKIAKVNFRVPAGTANTVLFNEAGLTIVGACAAGSALSLTATTSKGASSIFTFSNDDGTPADPLEDDFENAGFDPGDTLDLFAGDDADIAQVQFGYSNTDNQSVIGSLYTDEGGTPNCLVTGFITFG